NGTKKWSSDQILQLVSISENCVYAIDFQNNLIILNKNNGQRIKTLTIPYRTTVLCNGETDRIYLFSADGLIQCLHETQLQTPIIHHPDSYHIAADLAAAVDSKSSAGNDATPARVPQAGDNAGLNNDNSEDEDFQATDNYPDVEPADTENDEEMDEEEDEDIFGTDSDDSPSSAPVPNDGNDEEEEDPFDNL
ncbi:MAG: hypothetical protein IKW74_01825, partial [Thermoguttaceae bacterium]|nr:hypothetical protein [Thermoguttaceae bacterium]